MIFNVRMMVGNWRNPVVDEGFRGIHKQVLTPSKYYINTNAYTIYNFNTRVQTWKYAGNYKTAEITCRLTKMVKLHRIVLNKNSKGQGCG